MFRIANGETGGLRIAIGADEQPVTALVMADFEMPSRPARSTRCCPAWAKAPGLIEDVPDKHGVVAFRDRQQDATFRGLRPWPTSSSATSSTSMEPRLKFNAHDLARRLRSV